MGTQRFLAIRDTSDVEKNLANQVSDYVWGIAEKDNRCEPEVRYTFVGPRQKYNLISGIKSSEEKSDFLYIVPPHNGLNCVLEEGVPHFKLDIQKMIEVSNEGHEALFIISPNINKNTNGAEILDNLKIALLDSKTGRFVDYETREYLCSGERSKVALFAALFKMGDFPIYVMLVNTEFVENRCFDEYQGTDLTYISVLKESRSVKDEIFSPAFRKGFVTQIGRHEMFVHGECFTIEIFGEYLAEIPSIAKAIYEYSIVEKYKKEFLNLKEKINVYSNWPTRVDENGCVHVDLSNIALGETGYLKVEIEAGEFFKYWIYKTHRSIYEFVLHKVNPIAEPKMQGSIHSPGFY